VRKKLFYIILTVIIAVNSTFASGKKPFPKNDFGLPFAGSNEIIGTYCELRPNHFHGGLDIRTGGVIGRPVLSVGDGYVSRINISTIGYGKAIYITHPNGYTSVYAHLSEFPASIQWFITKSQYQNQQYEIEIFPEADLIKVKRGETIAYSGNSGASQGPHLHFEIRETKSEAPVNPLLFGVTMEDHIAPSIFDVFLYKRDSLEKVYNGHFPSISLPTSSVQIIKKGKKKKKIFVPVGKHSIAFGSYAFGATMRDYATSMSDNNGVNYVQLYLNDQLIYDCKLEEFMFSQMRMHNNYIDFKRMKQSGTKMHKLFKDNGSTLEFWNESPTDGWFTIDDTIAYHFRIVAKDVYGHSTEKKITLYGSPNGRNVISYIQHNKSASLCYANKDNLISVNQDFKIGVPKNALYSDYQLGYQKNYGINYTIGNTLVPLDKKIDLHFRLSNEFVKYANKFTVFSADGRSYGTELKNQNWAVASVKEFGTYHIVLDTIKPNITPVAINKNGYFSFQVSDGTSGIKDFDFYINGQWVLLEYDIGFIHGRIPNQLISGKHSIELIVRDNRLNEKKFTKIITVP